MGLEEIKNLSNVFGVTYIEVSLTSGEGIDHLVSELSFLAARPEQQNSIRDGREDIDEGKHYEGSDMRLTVILKQKSELLTRFWKKALI